MKTKKYFAIILSIFFLTTACIDNDGGGIDDSKAKGVNDFVWKGLNSWYYWKEDVPVLSDNAFASQQDYNRFVNSTTPDNLFYNLLYQYKKVDRFSWIVDDLDKLLEQFNGISKSSGMNLDLMRAPQNKVLVVVNYIVPDSPADKLGIKRGNVILKVNNSPVTINNYRALFSDDFSISYVEKLEKNKDGELVPYGKIKQANLHSVVLEENPVAFVKTYNSGAKKIGYLVYNGFKSNYNDELNKAFLELKSQGVTDLILDLRYNGGGSVSTAVALGQMITGQYTGSRYVTTEYNKLHSRENHTDNFSDKVNIYDFVNGRTKKVRTEQINSLNLKKVYVLTSGGTASASELTITGLKPYISVVTVGEETYGKFVGSITLVNAPKNDYVYLGKGSYKWAMQPIVFSYYNANRDKHPSGGVLPDYEVSSINNYLGMKEFGDISSDPALRKAYELITGNSARSKRGFNLKSNPNYEVIGSTTTLLPFGTDMYVENHNL